MEHGLEILTIGHSTHDAESFLELLHSQAVEALCDVRRFPGSRRHPQFNSEALGATLPDAGISYERLGEELGGRRRSRHSRNAGWRVPTFRAYADHMETEQFSFGIERLEGIAREHRAAIMCAEGDWRRCHRRLISDALAVRGWRVLHVHPDGALEEHRMTLFATIEQGRVSYPPE